MFFDRYTKLKVVLVDNLCHLVLHCFRDFLKINPVSTKYKVFDMVHQNCSG